MRLVRAVPTIPCKTVDHGLSRCTTRWYSVAVFRCIPPPIIRNPAVLVSVGPSYPKTHNVVSCLRLAQPSYWKALEFIAKASHLYSDFNDSARVRRVWKMWRSSRVPVSCHGAASRAMGSSGSRNGRRSRLARHAS